MVTFALFSVAGIAGLALLLLPVGEKKTQALPAKTGVITQYELAQRLLDQPWTIRVLDTRKRKECAKKRIPGSECVPLDKLGDLGLEYAPASKDLVLVPEKDMKSVPSPAAKYKGKVLVLDGGFDGWESFALKDPPTPGADASEADRQLYSFRSALRQALTGAPPPPPPPSGVKKFVPKKRKKVAGCGGAPGREPWRSLPLLETACISIHTWTSGDGRFLFICFLEDSRRE